MLQFLAFGFTLKSSSGAGRGVTANKYQPMISTTCKQPQFIRSFRSGSIFTLIWGIIILTTRLNNIQNSKWLVNHFDTAIIMLNVLSFKGITSRICQLLFVNATFKIGPTSPVQSAHASGGPTYLCSGNWSLRFYRVPHLTPCTPLLAGGYTPLLKGWCSETSRAQQIRKSRQRAASPQIQTPPHTSSGS